MLLDILIFLYQQKKQEHQTKLTSKKFNVRDVLKATAHLRASTEHSRYEHASPAATLVMKKTTSPFLNWLIKKLDIT